MLFSYRQTCELPEITIGCCSAASSRETINGSSATGSLDTYGKREAMMSILDRLLAGGEQSQYRCWITGQRRREAAKAMLDILLAEEK